MPLVNWQQDLGKTKYKSAVTRLDRIKFQGGYNTETPPLEMDSGFVVDPLNFEIAINGGYRRVKGVERYDGQASPSSALYYTVPATGVGTWAQGDTLTGITSSATSVVIGETLNGFLVTKVVGNYVDTEDLQISAASVGTCGGEQYLGGGQSVLEDAQSLNLAADQYRADINAVPGSGSILGVNIYNGVQYAFRNAVGDATAEMYKSSASGWVKVELGFEVPFNSGGTTAIAVGDTVTGGTSTESGVVTGVAVRTGTFAGGDAVGILTFASISGAGFASGEALNVSATDLGTSTAVSSAITLNPDGRFQFENFNFGGASGTYKMYGCDNVSRAFEFDGTTFIPIATGMVDDTPKFITAHQYHLFLAFESSLQSSGTGQPFAWTPVLGASEIGLGDTITGLYPQVGSGGASGSPALLVGTRNRTFMLYGSSLSDWQLIEAEHEAGAIAYTMQKIGYTYVLDDRGVRQFGSTDSFGNFGQATMSKLIQSYISSKITKAVDSHVHRTKNQYRIFFDDKTAIYMTVANNQVVGFMPIQLAQQPTCSVSGELADGTEGIFFGGDDGYVYQMEKGTSFDGEPIDYRLQFTPHHLKSPDIDKRYRKCSLEIKGDAYISFDFGYQLDYNSRERQQPETEGKTKSLSSFIFDNFVWDNFFWDARTLEPQDIKLEGMGANIAIVISGSTDITASFTLTGAIIHYTIRKRKRS